MSELHRYDAFSDVNKFKTNGIRSMPIGTIRTLDYFKAKYARHFRSSAKVGSSSWSCYAGSEWLIQNT